MDALEDKEVRRAMEGCTGKRKRRASAYETIVLDDEDGQDEEMAGSEVSETAFSAGGKDLNMLKETVFLNFEPSVSVEPSAVAAVGSALQRNPDGSVIAPRVRQKTEGKKVRYHGWGQT